MGTRKMKTIETKSKLAEAIAKTLAEATEKTLTLTRKSAYCEPSGCPKNPFLLDGIRMKAFKDYAVISEWNYVSHDGQVFRKKEKSSMDLNRFYNFRTNIKNIYPPELYYGNIEGYEKEDV